MWWIASRSSEQEAGIRPLHKLGGYAALTAGLVGVGYYFYADAQNAALVGGVVPNSLSVVGPGSGAARVPPATPVPLPTLPAAVPAPTPGFPTETGMRRVPTGSTLPTPRQQNAAFKLLIEGHWHGMELIALTPALARVYNLAPKQTGLLVDEVTLAAAQCGMLAGDVVHSVGGMEINTLRDFQDATYLLRNQTQVEIGVLRGGRPLVLELRSERALGFAMFESAPPIQPGAISPHKDRNQPCTDCHLIMKAGGQLAIDAGDILPLPPAIAADATPPHGNKGVCNACHRIVGPAANAPLAQP